MTRVSPSDIAALPLPGQTQEADQAKSPKYRHRRGEIWMVRSVPGQPAVGTEIWSDRPAVVVSNNTINGRAGFAQVVYLSTSARKRSGPTHVKLPSPDGKGETTALCEQVHTVDASRLTRKMGEVPQGRVRDLDAAMALSLSIGRNPDTYGLFRKWEEQIKVYGIDIRKEIDALAGEVSNQRIESLVLALELMTQQRDAYRDLYETSQELPAAMKDAEQDAEQG